MARQRRVRQSGVPIVGDVEKFLDRMTTSVEDWGTTVTGYIQGVLKWLKKHRKLAIALLVLVIAYNWLLTSPVSEDGEYEDEE